MNKIPFSVYDFFAYLSSGGLIVAAVDYLFGYQWLEQDKLGTPMAILLIFLAYITGHIVAHFSSLFLEQFFIGKILKRPSSSLMGKKPSKILGLLFPGYYRALPKETQERIWNQAKNREFTGSGESLFLHAYSITSKDEKAQKRLDEFRNLYGFSRNLTLSFLLVALLFIIAIIMKIQSINPWWPLISFVFGVALLYRYLKFFRQYSYQLFITYSELE